MPCTIPPMFKKGIQVLKAVPTSSSHQSHCTFVSDSSGWSSPEWHSNFPALMNVFRWKMYKITEHWKDHFFNLTFLKSKIFGVINLNGGGRHARQMSGLFICWKKTSNKCFLDLNYWTKNFNGLDVINFSQESLKDTQNRLTFLVFFCFFFFLENCSLVSNETNGFLSGQG